MPKQLHERFPEILQWQIGDYVGYIHGTTRRKFCGVINDQIVLEMGHHLETFKVGRRSVCDRDAILLKDINAWFGVPFANYSLKEREEKKETMRLRAALENSQYNEFLKALAESQKELTERFGLTI